MNHLEWEGFWLLRAIWQRLVCYALWFPGVACLQFNPWVSFPRDSGLVVGRWRAERRRAEALGFSESGPQFLTEAFLDEEHREQGLLRETRIGERPKGLYPGMAADNNPMCAVTVTADGGGRR